MLDMTSWLRLAMPAICSGQYVYSTSRLTVLSKNFPPPNGNDQKLVMLMEFATIKVYVADDAGEREVACVREIEAARAVSRLFGSKYGALLHTPKGPIYIIGMKFQGE